MSRKTDAEVIFRDAARLNMTDNGYVWIVTEQALDAENAPEGLLGLKLVNATSEEAHIRDSMFVQIVYVLFNHFNSDTLQLMQLSITKI